MKKMADKQKFIMVIWFLLSCKRYLKRFSFLLILLLLPLGSLAFQRAEQKQGQNSKMRIAVSVEAPEDNSFGMRLARNLTAYAKEEGGMFDFYICGISQAKTDVAARKAECGYIIYKDLKEKLDSGNFRRCIGVVTAPSTVAAKLSAETVFSVLMAAYDGNLLKDYVSKSKIFQPLDGAGQRSHAVHDSEKLYEKYRHNGSTFHFDYKTVTADGHKELKKSESILPVRGLMALTVFITGLYAAVILCQDEKRGLFLPLAKGHALPCRVASLAAPVALSLLSGWLALLCSGTMGAPLREVLLLLGYGSAVVVFALLLKWLLRSGTVICCTIPFFVIGSLVFCPVFLDTTRLVPELSKLGRLFLPYYYLRLF